MEKIVSNIEIFLSSFYLGNLACRPMHTTACVNRQNACLSNDAVNKFLPHRPYALNGRVLSSTVDTFNMLGHLALQNDVMSLCKRCSVIVLNCMHQLIDCLNQLLQQKQKQRH
jgi:hypothetical protein